MERRLSVFHTPVFSLSLIKLDLHIQMTLLSTTRGSEDTVSSQASLKTIILLALSLNTQTHTEKHMHMYAPPSL